MACDHHWLHSVVQKLGDNHLTVRARVECDLDHHREQYMPALGPTQTPLHNDYRCCAIIAYEDFALGLVQTRRPRREMPLGRVEASLR